MALHNLFQNSADKRAYFEKAFVQWHERTCAQLQSLSADEHALNAAVQNLEQANAKLPVDADEILTATRAYNGARVKAEYAEAAPAAFRNALRGLRKSRPSVDEALATILDIREKVSGVVGNLTESTEKHYGPQSLLITMNTNMHLNGLSASKKAVLFEYFNLVQELSQDAPNVISLADEIAKRQRAGKLIGPSLPEQESAPVAQMK